MKKLMTLIGAVATAFGLLAADGPTVTGSASFESGEDGIAGGKFTPSLAGWTWAGDPLTLGDYDNDAYTYVDATGNKRRTDVFTAQNSYLKLETTKSEILELPKITGDSVFVDQLVQFTGFEEAPTVTGAKIAVWMSEEIVTEENEAEQQPEVTATNLYVTAGDNAVAVKIDNPENELWEIGRWYRLTIKSLGSIAEDGTVGFIVYIDGKQVASSDEAAKTLTAKELSAAHAALLEEGKLFPAMVTGEISTVGYNGIGAIDDITIDDQGPEFARFVDVTATQLAITGAKVVKIDGVDVTGEGPWSVKPGSIVVTYAADGAYIIKGNNPVTYSVTADSVTRTSEEMDIEPAVAKIGAVYYETVELALAAVEAAQDLDPTATVVVEFVADCNDENYLYFFTEGTTITVTEGGNWNVYVADAPESSFTVGALVNLFGAMPEKQITVTFEETTGFVQLGGNIYGNGRVDTLINVAGLVSIPASGLTIGDTFNVEAGAGAILKADSIYFEKDEESGDAAKITLVDSGKVMSKTQLTYTGVDSVFANEEEIEQIAPAEVGGYYTYQIKQEEPKTGFAIIIAGDDETKTNYYETLDLAIAAAEAGQTITVLANATLTAPCDITKALTLDLNGKTVTGNWDAGLNGVAGSRVYMFECGANAVTFENGTIASTANNIGALHTQGGNLTVNAIVNTKWRAIGAYDGATVVVGANAVLTTAGEDPTIFIWSNFANCGDTTVQCDVTIAGKVYNTFNGTRTSANLDAVIMGSGNDQGAGVKLTVAGGAEISGTACAGIYFPCAGLLEIGAASITGTEGVYVKGGASTVVNGAVITATGTANAFVADHNGHAWTGDAFVVDVSEGYAAVATQSISGGTFTSVNGAAVASYKETGATADRVTGFISGGSFRGAIDPAVDLIAIGSGMDTAKWKPTDDGFVVPFAFAAVAQIGDDGEKFESLAAAVAAAQTTDTVTLLKNTTLDATLEITKATTIDLNDKVVTLAANLAQGIYAHDAGTLTISNGDFVVAAGRENVKNSKAIYLLRTSAVFTDVTIDVPGFEYALTHMGNIADLGQDRNNYWTVPSQYTLDCNNVDVTGNGSLFHLEYVIADLDADCSATAEGTSFGGAHEAAIYSSCGAVVTVNGGTYEAPNALQTGNLGGQIIAKDGTFDGNIMSYMYAGDDRYLNNAATIKIEGGTFGDFAYATGPKGEACTKDQVTWNITGGSFAADPTEYLNAGYATVKNGNLWDVGAAIIATFKNADGDIVAAETNIVAFAPTAVPNIPEKAGYNAGVWTPNVTVQIDKNTEYTIDYGTAISYTITYKDGTDSLDLSPKTYTVEDEVTLPAVPVKENFKAEGWYNNATFEGDAVTKIAKGTIEAQTFYAKYTADEPDFPFNPDEELTEDGKANIETAKTVFGDGLAAYVAKVYGDGGKILASKLNGTTEDLIRIAKEYELPIMVAPTVTITQAASGVGFEFQILDENVPVALQEAKILSMVEFTDDLADATTPFATATTDNVTVAIKTDSDNKTATVDFKKATAAGFMRVNLKAEK